MPSTRDLITALEEGFPPDSFGLDLPIMARVGGKVVPIYLDRIAMISEPAQEIEGALVPGRSYVQIVVA